MKLNCTFTIRCIMDEYVAIPVGESALHFSGMMSTNAVGALVLEELREDRTEVELLDRILEEFEVDRQTAEQDLRELLQSLEQMQVLDRA